MPSKTRRRCPWYTPYSTTLTVSVGRGAPMSRHQIGRRNVLSYSRRVAPAKAAYRPQTITATTAIAKPADSQPMELRTRSDIGCPSTKAGAQPSLCHRRLDTVAAGDSSACAPRLTMSRYRWCRTDGPLSRIRCAGTAVADDRGCSRAGRAGSTWRSWPLPRAPGSRR